MTDSLLRRGQFSLDPVQRRDLAEALRLCATDAVASVVPAMHLEIAAKSGIVPTGLWCMRRRNRGHRELVAVVWAGANLTPIVAIDPDEDDDLRAELAAAILVRFARPAAIVGPSDLTLDLWGRLEQTWGPARQVRGRQVSMAISGDPRPGGEPTVRVEPLRRASLADYAALLPAAVHMFIGEVGYDPLRHGREAYEDRLTQLVRQGRSYVQYGEVGGTREIVFKAEVGVVGLDVAQVQGVWAHPEVRGRGVGTAGMREVVRQVRRDHAATVSLYVNDFNEAALRTYDKVGFARVGEFSTVMF